MWHEVCGVDYQGAVAVAIISERMADRLKILASVACKCASDILQSDYARPPAIRNKGIDGLMKAVTEADKKWNARVTTSKLNRWLEGAVERNSPPAPGGRRIKIRYGTQANARPPTFAIFGSQLKKLPESYLRYLTNGMREAFDLNGTPIRLSLRGGGDNPYDTKK